MRRMAATPPEHHFLERWQSGRQNRRERFWTAKPARSAQARRASLRMRRAYAPDGRHAAGASFFGEVAEWSTKSPGAILDSGAGPERASAQGESQDETSICAGWPPRCRSVIFWRGGRVVECAGFEIRFTVSP